MTTLSNHSVVRSTQAMFLSRLDTLTHLLERAEGSWGAKDSWLELRIVSDMLPLGTQIAFTCNQPRNFALWCQGKPADNLDPNVTDLATAHRHIRETKALLSNLDADDRRLEEIVRVDLGESMYLELPGLAYVNDFLVPNFYFHLVTAYDILRMAGLPIGKADYMRHLMPLVKRA